MYVLAPFLSAIWFSKNLTNHLPSWLLLDTIWIPATSTFDQLGAEDWGGIESTGAKGIYQRIDWHRCSLPPTIETVETWPKWPWWRSLIFRKTPSFQWASLGQWKHGFNNLLTSQITKSLIYTLPPIMVQWKMGPNKLKNEFSSLFPLWWCVLKKSILSHDCGIFLHITTNKAILSTFTTSGKDNHRSSNPAWLAMIHLLPQKITEPLKDGGWKATFLLARWMFWGAMLNFGGVRCTCNVMLEWFCPHPKPSISLFFHFTSWNMFKSHCWPFQLSMELGNKHGEVKTIT